MSEISKLITKYIEDFVLSCEKDNKNDIVKEFKTKENKKKLDDFLASNNIKKKKNKNSVDVDKPKKPLTPYFIYVKDKRNDVKTESGIVDNLELTKELSKRWNAMKLNNSDEFQKYNEISEKQRNDYFAKMKDYNDKNGIVDKQKTAFQIFKEDNTASVLSEFPGISKKDVNKKLQLKWKELLSGKWDDVKKYMDDSKESRDEKKLEVDNFEIEEKNMKKKKTSIKKKSKESA